MREICGILISRGKGKEVDFIEYAIPMLVGVWIGSMIKKSKLFKDFF